MSLTALLSSASDLISAVGDAYDTLSTDFGSILLIPVVIVLAESVIRLLKSVLLFKKKESE